MSRVRPAWVLLGLLLSLGTFPGCGPADDGLLTLSLSLDPRTLPPNLAAVDVYVLLAVMPDDTPLECSMFVGPTATEVVYDYTDSGALVTIVSGDVDPNFEPAISLPNLPEGLLVFVVEALDSSGAHLAWGCGRGQIEAGKKAFIPIYFELG